MFFLSIAISQRKRQNNQKEIKRGTTLIIPVYSPDRKSERIHAQKSHLKQRPGLNVKARHPREHLLSCKNDKMQYLFYFNFEKV